MKNRRAFLRAVLAALATALLAGASPSVTAGPPLYWWHLPLKTDNAECMRRAERAFASKNVPIMKLESNKLVGYTEDTTAIIKCLKQTDQILVIIIVAGKGAKATMESFRDVVRSDTGAAVRDPESPTYVGGDVEPPRKISGPNARYTKEARKARVQGVVIAQVVIDETGSVRSVKVLKGLSHGLSEAAVDALEKWKYHPATRNGEPVAVYYNLTVNFRLE